MKNLDELIKDGFFVSEVRRNRGNIADHFLVESLRAFFSTAEDLDWYLSSKIDEKASKEILVGSYARNACNAITQFQHFFELFLKDILLEHNKLLVYDASQKPELLIKLINGEKVLNSELEKMHFIECSEAILRIKALHKSGKLDSNYLFVANYIDLFEKLNALRNRIAHRGAFIITPPALNEVFGRFVFPFINELENVKGYGNLRLWSFNLKTRELNPFEAISKDYFNGLVDENKIHLYKLIGAASYKNKIDFDLDEVFSVINDEIREQAESIAQTLADRNRTVEAIECPICGCNSFVREMDCYVGEDEYGNEITSEPYVYRISCGQCGFHIENWLLSKLKEFNIPMLDYSQWYLR